MPHSSCLTNIPEEQTMRKVLRVNEFFFFCVYDESPILREQARRHHFPSLSGHAIRYLHWWVSQTHRPSKNPPSRQNCLTPVRALLIGVRCYVPNNVKNVSSVCCVQCDCERKLTRYVADLDFHGHRSAVSGNQHFHRLPAPPPPPPFIGCQN